MVSLFLYSNPLKVRSQFLISRSKQKFDVLLGFMIAYDASLFHTFTLAYSVYKLFDLPLFCRAARHPSLTRGWQGAPPVARPLPSQPRSSRPAKCGGRKRFEPSTNSHIHYISSTSQSKSSLGSRISNKAYFLEFLEAIFLDMKN